MNVKMKRGIGRLVVFLVLFYFAGGLALYLCQDFLLFHPTPLAKNYRFHFDQPYEEVNLPVEGGNLNILQFKPPFTRKGIVLFFHGNMANTEHYNQYPFLFTRNGYEVCMMDYPGFGKSTGKRSETIIERQSMLLYERAIKLCPANDIMVYGKSIGTGVASWLAASTKIKRLILETPYYSIRALAHYYFPIYPAYLTRYAFPVNEYLQKINSPITLLHGTDDEVIPYKQALQLTKEKPGAQLITIPNGKHNNLFSFRIFQHKIDSLLSQ